jgi:hypothetical protein
LLMKIDGCQFLTFMKNIKDMMFFERVRVKTFETLREER